MGRSFQSKGDGTMSLCVCLQSKDKFIVGADTAVTLTTGNKKVRSKEGMEKLFKVGEYLIFTCGDVATSQNVIRDFQKAESKTHVELQRIIKARYQQLISERPEEVYKINKKESPLSVICFKTDAKGNTISYAFNPINNFKIETRRGVDDGFHLIVGGFEADRAERTFYELYNRGIRDPEVLISRTFRQVSGESVGGELTLYTGDRNGSQLVSKRKIHETLKYDLVDVVLKEVIVGMATGGTITGSFMRTESSGRRIELDRRGFRAMDASGTTRISIQTDSDQGIAGIGFNDSSGSWQGQIIGAYDGFHIGAHHGITVNSGIGPTVFESSVRFNRGAIGLDVSNISGLSSELSSLSAQIREKADSNHTHSEYAVSMAFDPGTRNLKLYNRNGSVLSTVNIPK